MNILIFGPNGSGKGTQGAIVQKKYGVPHIETGVIFRQNISKKTPLGEKAKAFIDRGELVPDDITIPMILDRLKEDDAKNGWLLDGFPRNLAQAEALWAALQKENIKLDIVIEIDLDRETAKKRIMGRRLCKTDNNHPNNIYIDAIKPSEKTARPYAVCAAARNYPPAPMIRIARQSTSGMGFTMTRRPEHWLLSTISRKELKSSSLTAAPA